MPFNQKIQRVPTTKLNCDLIVVWRWASPETQYGALKSERDPRLRSSPSRVIGFKDFEDHSIVLFPTIFKQIDLQIGEPGCGAHLCPENRLTGISTVNLERLH